MAKFGVFRPVDRYQSGSLKVAMSSPGRLILHTAVSSSASMHDYFNVAGRATPHFYVNSDGDIEQYIDTGFESTANLDGNHDSITVESWDGFPGEPAPGWHPPAWTDAQVEALAALAVWCHETHGVPLEQLPSSLPGSRGVGWHRLGIDGNFPAPPGHLLGGRVAGGESWTLSQGKECPGNEKIHGVVNRIIPRAKDLLIGEDDMQLDDKIPGTKDKTVGDALKAALTAERRSKNQIARFQALGQQIATTQQRVTSIPDPVTREEVKKLLENIDAEIQVVVSDNDNTDDE